MGSRWVRHQPFSAFPPPAPVRPREQFHFQLPDAAGEMLMNALWSPSLYQLDLYFKAEQQILVVAPSQPNLTKVWRKSMVEKGSLHV